MKKEGRKGGNQGYHLSSSSYHSVIGSSSVHRQFPLGPKYNPQKRSPHIIACGLAGLAGAFQEQGYYREDIDLLERKKKGLVF